MSLHILEWLKLKANTRKCEWKCAIIGAFILRWWEYKISLGKQIRWENQFGKQFGIFIKC